MKKNLLDQDPELSQILSQDSKLLEIDKSIDLTQDIKDINRKVAADQHGPRAAPSERILAKGDAPTKTKAVSEALDHTQNSDSKTIIERQISNP